MGFNMSKRGKSEWPPKSKRRRRIIAVGIILIFALLFFATDRGTDVLDDVIKTIENTILKIEEKIKETDNPYIKTIYKFIKGVLGGLSNVLEEFRDFLSDIGESLPDIFLYAGLLVLLAFLVAYYFSPWLALIMLALLLMAGSFYLGTEHNSRKTFDYNNQIPVSEYKKEVSIVSMEDLKEMDKNEEVKVESRLYKYADGNWYLVGDGMELIITWKDIEPQDQWNGKTARVEGYYIPEHKGIIIWSVELI